jgi:hypothetical protein
MAMCYILWPFEKIVVICGIFSPVLVYCINKNLAIPACPPIARNNSFGDKNPSKGSQTPNDVHMT